MKVHGNTADPTSTVKGGHVHSAKSGHKTSKTEGSGEANTSATSSTSGEATKSEISSKARELANAKQIATSAPDIREEKIARLKEMISNGKYKVDPHAVADRMVDEHLSTEIG